MKKGVQNLKPEVAQVFLFINVVFGERYILRISGNDVKEYLAAGGEIVASFVINFYGDTINQAGGEAFDRHHEHYNSTTNFLPSFLNTSF